MIGQAEVAVRTPQRAEAQQHERAAQAGQDIVEAQEVEGDGREAEAPEHLHHGLAPGADGTHHILGRGGADGLVKQRVQAFFIHSAHLPARRRGAS